MAADQPKWYCPCGQINAGYLEKCINCGGSSAEGSDTPPSLEEALQSGRPLAPPGAVINVTDRILTRVRIHEDDQTLVVTERRIGRWIGFLLLVAASVLFGLFLASFMPPGALANHLLWVYTSPVMVPALLFGCFGTFPHIRLAIARHGKSCDLQKRWLVFVYATRTFPLDKYLLTGGQLHHRVVTEQEAAWSLVAKFFLGPIAWFAPKLGQHRTEAITRFATIAARAGLRGDQYNLVAFRDGGLVDRVLAGARRFVPDRVFIEHDSEE
jgi:hypothetical protein